MAHYLLAMGGKTSNEIKLSVVIPCYNEGKNIDLVVNRFLMVNPNNTNVELILIDNGSTDNSHKIISNYAKKYSFIKLVHVDKNIGYGNGVWQGLKNSKGEYLCWTHADMQTDLADTIKAYDIAIEQKNSKKCFVKGNRKKRPLFDNFFALGMSIFETIMLGKILYDINAQPNLFHRSFLNNIKNPPMDFSFDLYLYYLAKKFNYKIIRFPVLFQKRIHGESHWSATINGKWKFIKRTMNFTFKLKRKLKNADNNP